MMADMRKSAISWFCGSWLVLAGCGDSSAEDTGFTSASLPSTNPVTSVGTTGIGTTTADTTGGASESPTSETTTSPTSSGSSSTSSTTDGGTSTTDSGSTGPEPGCGNGVIEGSEECDDGAMNADEAACKSDCTAQACGDGFVGPGEGCDDGNTVDDDECSNLCAPATCGNGVVDGGEECDDANADNLDACTNMCTAAACGDGFVQAGEQCDDGNIVDTDMCTATCKTATCGDGKVFMGNEECDDGNMVNTDACINTCKNAACGDTFLQAGEECDDGNKTDGDGCSAVCKITGCVPNGQRAPLNTLGINTASGCWDGNPCDDDSYAWDADGQNFQAFGQAISCTGASTCIANVGITTYESSSACQGTWDVLCDGVLAGSVSSLGKSCSGSAMANGCKATFTPRTCATVELRAANDGDQVAGCCGGNQPDSMITSVSAW